MSLRFILFCYNKLKIRVVRNVRRVKFCFYPYHTFIVTKYFFFESLAHVTNLQYQRIFLIKKSKTNQTIVNMRVINQNTLYWCPQWFDHRLSVLELVTASCNNHVSPFIVVKNEVKSAVIRILCHSDYPNTKTKFVLWRKLEILRKFSDRRKLLRKSNTKLPIHFF